MKAPQLLWLAALLASTAAQAQSMGNAQYGRLSQPSVAERGAISTAQPNDSQTITLRVSGLANVVPTSYVAWFSLVQVGSTPEVATGLLRERVRAFQRSLTGLGIDSTRLHVDVISFVPRFELQADKRVFSKRYNEVPAGYELQQTVSVLYHQEALTASILRAAAQAEIIDLIKVDVSVADPNKPAEQLREQCLALLKRREQAWVSAGIRLDTLRRVPTESSAVAYPPSRYAGYQAAARPSLEAARASRSLLGGQPTITEVQPTTARYYNPVAPDQYDLVINPTFTEPAIQYSYSLLVQYIPRPPRKAPRNYLILNGNGEAKPLQLEP